MSFELNDVFSKKLTDAVKDIFIRDEERKQKAHEVELIYSRKRDLILNCVFAHYYVLKTIDKIGGSFSIGCKGIKTFPSRMDYMIESSELAEITIYTVGMERIGAEQENPSITFSAVFPNDFRVFINGEKVKDYPNKEEEWVDFIDHCIILWINTLNLK